MTDIAFPITIFHNPACGTSRNTVAMVQAAGYAPQVVEYLKTGWTREQLQDLAAKSGGSLRALMREKGAPAETLGLLADEVSDERLLDAMVEHPILVNRPIVVTPLGVKLCRPSEQVLDLLDRKPEQFSKEDGEVVTP
ncbi:arsenate reductase (glutaredoxin) [Caulobacter vibrioides]|uniref:arsenate reductase (glutaredoxin) n=1 Tax=Caulobacter vibrioides TaxID=155892 RepID=UPI000BB4A1CE|nr:arsenate reductase (glutaredoxin) [Caulobacter vibrioides]ATC24515.1 arsenate reductase (glutaredoxin) [Caulobacter vibrioides]AZH12665.1 arsenate reductase (glutaredoxin) [Caulobacter vibrioides]PLR15100.1 arsenate reductase (glutaredoxin) [Caulobacter vibrioides]